MELLTSLGVNSSLAVQFAIFVVCYGILKYVLFDPYFAAFSIRSTRTVGQTELAEQYLNDKKDLDKRFALRAQEVNEAFRAVYDVARADALREYERVVGESRARAKNIVDETSATIAKDVAQAQGQLQSDVAEVAKLINNKLIGKDMHS